MTLNEETTAEMIQNMLKRGLLSLHFEDLLFEHNP
jgi:hypothetical protein